MNSDKNGAQPSTNIRFSSELELVERLSSSIRSRAVPSMNVRLPSGLELVERLWNSTRSGAVPSTPVKSLKVWESEVHPMCSITSGVY